ncbi:MAG: MlaD family protein [Bacteroidales bacterium]
MKLSREFLIGLIVTIALALLYWGINFLKGEDVFTNDRVFVAIYNDVGGLEKANPVSINGFQVGQVRNMSFSSDGSSNIIIEIVIKNPIAIPKNSTAKIVSSDLLGSKAVEIKLGNASELAVSGDTLIAEIEISIKEEVSRQIQPIKNKAENLMQSIDTVLTMLQSVFVSSNTDNLSKSVEHFANSFENLEHTTKTLDAIMTSQEGRLERILANIESITLNLKNNEDNLNNILANFSSLSDTLAKANVAETIAGVNTTMKEIHGITSKINQGEGSLGMLVNNDSLYLELEKTSRELNLLLEDIRLNPKRYVKFSLF